MSDLNELYRLMGPKEYAKAVIEARSEQQAQEKDMRPLRHIPWKPRVGNAQQEEPIGDYRRFMWRSINRKEEV